MSYAYSVAIKLSVTNLATQGLRLLTGDLLSANAAAGKLGDKLKALKTIAIGYGLEKVGSSMFGFLEKSIDASKEYTRQLSLMNAAGMDQREIALSTASAWKTSRDVLTTTAADNLKAIRELRSVFGNANMAEAYAILPTVQRTKGIMEALTGKAQDNIAFQMVKTAELRTPGVMSQQAMQRNAELMSRTLMAFGGTLDPSDFMMAGKQLKATAFGFSDEFFYEYLPTFIQEAKGKGGTGSSAATALRTMMNMMIGGIGITKASVPIWEEMGLINPSDVVKNATGQFQLKPGAMKGAALAQANPEAWAQKYGGAISGYAEKHHLSLLQTVMSMAKNTNAAWALYTLLVKQPQFERDKKLIEGGGTSIEMYQNLMKTNPQLAEEALKSQWQNLLSIIGYNILPRLIPYMVKFADSLDNISQWMQKHPNLTQGLVIGLGALAASFSVIGTALMTAGMIKFLGLGPIITSAATGLGAVALGLIAVTAAVAGAWWIQDHFHWDEKIGGWLNDAVNGKYDPNAKTGGTASGTINRGDAIPVASGTIKGVNDKGGSIASRPAHKSEVHVHVHASDVNLDGHKIASILFSVGGKSAQGPQTGISGFDDIEGRMPAGGLGY